MGDFLSHATMPNGQYVMIGDTGRRDATGDSSSEAEFAASAGTSGSSPNSVSKLYDAGYFFSRSGWGGDQAFEDEVFLSVRFGPGRTFHGHEDGGSITLYGYGSSLLIDSGKYTYNSGPWRDYFVGPLAHNGVLVEGVPYSEGQPTELQYIDRTDEYDFLSLERPIAEDATWSRDILFARAGYVVVVDRISQSEPRPVHQLWHLVQDAEPDVQGNSVVTQRTRGNLALMQLAETESISIVQGSEDPVQGWVSYDFGVREPAPTVVATNSGETVVFVTLLAPFVGGDPPEIRAFEITDNGIDLALVYLGRHNTVRIADSSIEFETAIDEPDHPTS
jgi:hypothetical protein